MTKILMRINEWTIERLIALAERWPWALLALAALIGALLVIATGAAL